MFTTMSIESKDDIDFYWWRYKIIRSAEIHGDFNKYSLKVGVVMKDSVLLFTLIAVILAIIVVFTISNTIIEGIAIGLIILVCGRLGNKYKSKEAK